MRNTAMTCWCGWTWWSRVASAFANAINLQLSRYTPEKAKEIHIRIARQALARRLAGEASPPSYTIEVDGRPAASEASVKPYGVIVYAFTKMREIADYALMLARDESPFRSGRYRASWFLLKDGREISLAAMSNNDTVTLSNDQPYSRKINVGAKGFEKYAHPGVVERVRQKLLRRYNNLIDVDIEFLKFEGGHVLRKSLYRKTKTGRAYGGPRKDSLRGMDITYPSLVIAPKGKHR